MISLQELEKYYQDGLLQKQTHPNYDLTIWNYSPKVQYDKLWDDITIQCRGLVTNSNGDIIARPFKKFFNYEEVSIHDTPDEEFEIFEIIWGESAESPIHDHSENGCILVLMDGKLEETIYDKDAVEIKKNIVNCHEPSYIHNSIGLHKIKNMMLSVLFQLVHYLHHMV